MSADDRDKLDALQRALDALRGRLGPRDPALPGPPVSKGPEAPGEPVDPTLAARAASAMNRLRALRATPPSDLLEPLRDELLSLARRQLTAGDGPSAAIALEALLDSLAPSHPQREEVARLAARARGSRARKDGVRSISLSDLERKGFRQVKVLRAGEINELLSKFVTRALERASKSAGVDEQLRERLVSDARAELDRRMQAMQETVEAGDVDDDPDDEAVVDPALSAGYLLMAAQDGELTPEETASLEDRLGAADPILRVEWVWLERARAALGRVATFVPADADPLWDRLNAGVQARLDERSTPRREPALDEIEQVRRRLDVKLEEANRQLAAERQAFLREKQALRASLAVAAGPGLIRRGSIEVASVHVPAAGEPTGDLVDVTERAGGVDVLIGDVSGRGAASALAAAATRAAVHAALALGAEPSAALAAANRALKRTLAPAMFVAASLVRWDDARGRAVIAGAGHEDVIIYRAGGRVERLKPGGVVLGVVETTPTFAPREVELGPGDALVLVSDGVTEAPGPGGELFCDPAWTRLLGVVAARGHLDAPDLVGAVRDAVSAWGGRGEQAPEDDVVVVALRRTPATPPPSTKAALVASMLGLDAFFGPGADQKRP
jgi:serine phosphatase RsbU (regulator of sigma subunit)